MSPDHASVARSAARAAKLVWLLGPWQAASFLLARARGEPRIRLRLRGLEHALHCRTDGSDVHCLWQVFGLRDGEVDLEEDPEVIVDGGANVGYASVYYAARYPRARILAVEPDAGNLAVAAANLRPYPNVTLVAGAIWSRDTALAIENPLDPPWAFRVGEGAASAACAVPGFTIASLLKEHGLERADLVKLDIEGAEKELFERGPLDWLERTRAIVIELHGDARGVVERTLRERGGTISEGRGEKLLCRFARQPPR